MFTNWPTLCSLGEGFNKSLFYSRWHQLHRVAHLRSSLVQSTTTFQLRAPTELFAFLAQHLSSGASHPSCHSWLPVAKFQFHSLWKMMAYLFEISPGQSQPFPSYQPNILSKFGKNYSAISTRCGKVKQRNRNFILK